MFFPDFPHLIAAGPGATKPMGVARKTTLLVTAPALRTQTWSWSGMCHLWTAQVCGPTRRLCSLSMISFKGDWAYKGIACTMGLHVESTV